MQAPGSQRTQPAWESITEIVIGSAFQVANTLGAGFLEKVYENALAHELRKQNLQVVQQHGLQVRYDGIVVGEYAADLLVEDTVLVELKVCREFDDIHMAQCLNYLKASDRPVCLLINFGISRIKVRRILNPAIPSAWIHPADDIDDDPTGFPASEPVQTPSEIRVHPCSSVVPPR